MEFTEILRRRRMVRSFDERPLAAPVVERILAAAVRAPSAGFTQGVDLVVLSGHGETARYWGATLDEEARASFPWPGLLRAPLLVVVVASEDAYRRRYAEPDKRGRGLDPAPRAARDQGGVRARAVEFEVPWWYVDAAFAALLLQLAAVDAGLGALFFQSHRVPALRQTFGIPPSHAPVGTVAIGHPADDRPSSSVATRARRHVGDVVHHGGW
jgi:nitroreductase